MYNVYSIVTNIFTIADHNFSAWYRVLAETGHLLLASFYLPLSFFLSFSLTHSLSLSPSLSLSLSLSFPIDKAANKVKQVEQLIGRASSVHFFFPANLLLKKLDSQQLTISAAAVVEQF